jgi:23S rRNA (uridine2552-2'-O)-methyltransferase
MSDPGDGEKRRWRGPTGAPGNTSGRGGEKQRAHRVKTASSKAWVERQLNDPYVQRAKAEGLRARAAFKLIELDEKFGLLRPGLRIVDLGAAPGGWAQVVVQRGAGQVVGIDLLPVEPLNGALFLQADFLTPEGEAAVIAALGGPPDLVLSDMAANTTGHRPTDQIKTGVLAEAAAHFAMDVLKPGGAFVTKAFQGGLEGGLLATLKSAFIEVRHAKPKASRPESPEIYMVAKGFRGKAAS